MTTFTCEHCGLVLQDPVLPVYCGCQSPPITFNRPGTCLKLILGSFGIASNADCSCNDYANGMDFWGINTCEERIDEIIAHIQSQEVSLYYKARLIIAGYFSVRSLVQAAIDKARVHDPVLCHQS